MKRLLKLFGSTFSEPKQTNWALRIKEELEAEKKSPFANKINAVLNQHKSKDGFVRIFCSTQDSVNNKNFDRGIWLCFNLKKQEKTSIKSKTHGKDNGFSRKPNIKAVVAKGEIIYSKISYLDRISYRDDVVTDQVIEEILKSDPYIQVSPSGIV